VIYEQFQVIPGADKIKVNLLQMHGF